MVLELPIQVCTILLKLTPGTIRTLGHLPLSWVVTARTCLT